MFLNDAIRIADELRDNAISEAQKLIWLNELEMKIQSLILRTAPDDMIVYEQVDDTELLVPRPFDKVYYLWLAAMIDYGNAEYDKYQNDKAMADAAYSDYAKWFMRHFHDDCGNVMYIGGTTKYGLSAYQIAVNHGFVGTEEEWVESLKGEDAYKIAVAGGYTGTEAEFYAQLGVLDDIEEHVSADAAAAEAAADRTEAAASRVETAALHAPKVENGNWWVYDAAQAKAYKDTGIAARGPEGPQGPAGAAGPTGAQGPKGEKGDKGDTGPAGPQGVQGATGKQGPQGIQGETGPQGPKGDTGAGFKVLDYYSTLAALKAAVPNPADGVAYGVGTAAPYDIYIYGKTAGWVNNGPLQGAKGDPGEKGDAFTYNDFTADQLAALKGEKGDKGDTGEKGADGAKGDKGDKGDTGATGPQGEQGIQGIQGVQGEKGADGDDGVGIQSVTQTTTSSADGGENVVTVTLTNGTKSTFKFKNGSKGSDGAAGKDGANGKDGADGKTPVKGTDYFTDADKTEMVNEVNTLMGAANTDYSTVRARGIAIVANEAVSVPNGCLCAVYSTS